MTYRVHEIYPTLQGEGAMTGVPMVILRLQGCAVGCPWCDTKETWDFSHGTEMGVEEIVHAVQAASRGHRWVMLTGGEPAAYSLESLVSGLHTAGYQVALETSGTETGHVDANCNWVCVSPKSDMPGNKEIQPQAVAYANEIKFVVGKQADIDAIDSFLATYLPNHVDSADIQISLQPLSRSAKATQLCIDAVQQYGYRLSLQTHKLIDIP